MKNVTFYPMIRIVALISVFSVSAFQLSWSQPPPVQGTNVKVDANGNLLPTSVNGHVIKYPPASHTHPESDVTNLVTDLAAKQPLDSDLTSIAALSTTGFGRGFLTLADAAASRTYIGAGTSSFNGLFTGLDFTGSNLTSIATRNFSALQNVPYRVNNATVFNVKDYGAVGDGTTNDTTAISNAIAAIPSTGGVLYFPASSAAYKVTAGFTLNKPITVQGDGGFGTASTSILGRSTISFSTTAGTLFTVTANGCIFKDIHLHNPSGTTPTGGAGISVTSNGQFTRYQSITVSSFYINIDHQTGELSTWENCFLTDPVLYDLKLQNTNTFDGGDWSIKGCNFNTSRAATSAIRLESGGGLKITNTKINANVGANGWTNGIDVHLVAGVVSGDLLISNCSIEGYGGAGAGIKLSTVDGSSFYRNILIDGVQFGAFGTTNSGSAVSVSSTSANQFNQMVVLGCTAYASPTSTGTAYTFNNANTVRFDPNNLAVGYAQPVSFTNVSGTNYEYRNPQLPDGAMAYGVSVTNPSTAYNASPLAGIGLATVYDSVGNTAGMGGLSIGKQNGTSGDLTSFLSLYTRVNGANITENLRIAPDSSLYTDGALKYNLQVVNQTAYNSSPLSGIVFQNKYTSGGSFAGMGGIAVGKNNNTDGDYGSFLSFYARTNGSSLSEFGRFSTSGGLSIGSTTDPGAGNLLLNGLTPSSFIETDSSKVLVSKTASQMRTDLGLVIGTNVQAYDADLDALAALTGTHTLYYRSAANTWTAVTIGSGLDFSGATLSATGSGTGDFSSNTSTSVDGEIVLFSGTGGKTGKRATGSGIATVSGGVLGTTTNNSTNWDTAFTDRMKWDGGATGLVAATGRTSLGLVIGTNVEAWNANLDSWAAIAPSTIPTLPGTNAFTGSNSFSKDVTLSGTLTPTALSADQNDYNPTNLATALTLRIDGGAADRNITGLAGGADGRIVEIINIGSTNLLVLKDQSASSSATNRFLNGADITVGTNKSVVLRYDGTSSRWRAFDRALVNTGVTAASYGDASHIPSFTVDVQGRLSAASSNTFGIASLSDAGTLATWAGITPATGVGTFLGTPTLANLKAALTDETTVGWSLFSATNPSAISFPKVAADNSVSFRTPAQVLSDIGAQASGSYAASGANTDITSIKGITGQVEYAKGANVASANNLALGSDGNVFHITGTTQVNLLSSTGWQAGSQVTLIFDGALTVKHNQAVSGANKPILLLGAADRTTAANTVLQLTYDGTSWFETNSGLGTLAKQSGTFSGTSSGTNTGDQTITLTGDVTGSGTGSFAATIANSAVTEAKMSLADNTTGNVSTSAHGFAPKAPNDATQFLNGTGAYSVPASVGGLLAFNGVLTSQTSISATTTDTTGGVTLTSQTAANGSVWRVRAQGQYVNANSATARNAQISVYWGTTQLTPTLAPAVKTSNGSTWDFNVEFILNATSTTAVWAAGQVTGLAFSANVMTIGLNATATPASTTVTSGTQTIDLRFSMSNSGPADTWKINAVTIERLK